MMKLTLTFLLVLAVLEIAAKPRNALERSAHGQESNRNNKASRDEAAVEEFEDAVDLVYCFKIKKGEMLRSINTISIFDALESSVITEETTEEIRNELHPENILFPQSVRDLSKAENHPNKDDDILIAATPTIASSDDADDAEDFEDAVNLVYCFKIKKEKW